ncbi:bifunctional metallophosphatase/5'-nucleotidase [Atopomonas sediminilitoris]|uniref:bifunctional metallophosphatase/5'-nucleotidase n=1 Tax=Atopomonas sediminilitoris TaxID=2919919 RepID=UPI001F4EE5F7|nr:bifunctional UDP-sugar hydrolase/5'-nucleotidase [Atopomonas sediminilitoris]MCJ8170016.1 bifunctional metallophosphatase/5'-nucleotidase [Atopomonas sediminilitoris]
MRLPALSALCLSLCLPLAATLHAADKTFTILHTNDWQSRLLGFGPNNEFTPATVNDDSTVGGVARLATLLDERRAAMGDEPVLLLDGGDFTMGTLFHTVTRDLGGELRLMAELGYDAAVLGNHEFDFRPQGLATMISAAAKAQGDRLPQLLSSNMRFDPASPDDDRLKAHYDAGLIKPYKVLERGGIRFGLFGLLGEGAVQVSPMTKPLSFAKPVEVARAMVQQLREVEKVDVVILLSHMGVKQEANGSWRGEEVELVEQVPGIDIVVGGHSHTALPRPILVNGKTPVMQAGSEIQHLGELRMRLTDNGPQVQAYTLHPINDKLAGKAAVTADVEQFKQVVTEQMLAPKGYQFEQALAQTPRTLTRAYDDQLLGNLVTDAIRHATQSDIAFTGNGTIRDDVMQGAHGVQSVSDLFRIAPLGIGETDDAPGYPLMKAYVSAQEIKSVLEVLLVAYQMRDDSYYPRLSGLKFTYNPYRVPFDRVEEVWLGNPQQGYQALDLSAANTQLYSIGATTYVGSFTWLIPDISKGLLSVVPKDAQGQPLADVKAALIDADAKRAGVQEYKEWQALLDHVRGLPDSNGDGLADIADDDAANELRMIRHASFNPTSLLRNAGALQWSVTLGVPLLVVLLLLWWWRRKRRV